MLLAEHVPAQGRVLVLGAGGGLELKALADDHPAWTFDGVDPSADMLEQARFSGVSLFYAGLSFRGLVCYA